MLFSHLSSKDRLLFIVNQLTLMTANSLMRANNDNSYNYPSLMLVDTDIDHIDIDDVIPNSVACHSSVRHVAFFNAFLRHLKRFLFGHLKRFFVLVVSSN